MTSMLYTPLAEKARKVQSKFNAYCEAKSATFAAMWTDEELDDEFDAVMEAEMEAQHELAEAIAEFTSGRVSIEEAEWIVIRREDKLAEMVNSLAV